MKATTGFAIILRRGAAPLLLVCAMGTLAPGAHAAAVAMVTDLQGKATLSSGGMPRGLTICAELDTGGRVQLGAGATLVVLYLDTGDEYVFKGPARFEVRPAAPAVRDGASPLRRSLSLGRSGKDVRIRPVGIAQGALVMRSMRPTAPAAELLAQAESLRPPADAPLSTRVAYAAWLEGAQLKDEARKVWKAAAAERPDDARLKALAAQ
ncbi:MAG: hypothetical protein KAX84_14050 [Burkholderiales bacterium]|nr:hypothetical protein [Burkholderiales bacterium]